MKRKIVSLLMMLTLMFVLASCDQKEVLFFLNWGEYIDEELIKVFEEEYNCRVKMDLADSNEIMYSRVNTTKYDLICPSDYMVEKMYKKGILSEIDFSEIPSFSRSDLREGVKSITAEMESHEGKEDIAKYFVPYLWGTWGIMYNTELPGLKEAVTDPAVNGGNEWACLFNRDILPKKTRVAMYDSHLHAYYAASRYLGVDDNMIYNEISYKSLKQIESTVKNMKYNAWGTDNIKKDIVAGNIDIGFMWTGDFLYYYCENIANIITEAYMSKEITIDEFIPMLDALTSTTTNGYYTSVKGKKYTVGFDLSIPSDTVAFCDNLVIPKKAKHKSLAYKFIDFMCSNTYTLSSGEEVAPAFANTYYVCYDTPFISTYNILLELKNTTFDSDDEAVFKTQKSDPYDSDLYWKIYDYANAIGFTKYYKIDDAKGHILPSLDKDYVDIINTAFNNARI